MENGNAKKKNGQRWVFPQEYPKRGWEYCFKWNFRLGLSAIIVFLFSFLCSFQNWFWNAHEILSSQVIGENRCARILYSTVYSDYSGVETHFVLWFVFWCGGLPTEISLLLLPTRANKRRYKYWYTIIIFKQKGGVRGVSPRLQVHFKNKWGFRGDSP